MTLIFAPVSIDIGTARALEDSMAFYRRVGPEGYNGCYLRSFDREGRGGADGRKAVADLEMGIYPRSEGRPALIWDYHPPSEGVSCPIMAVVHTIRIARGLLVVTGRRAVEDGRLCTWTCPITGMPETAPAKAGQTTLEAFACRRPWTAASPRSGASIGSSPTIPRASPPGSWPRPSPS